MTNALALRHWLLEFLSRRALDEPTAAPLFSYRVSDAEFCALRDLLSDAAAVSLEQAATTPEFQQLVVLYAADWWKRRYQGGAWVWNPIFASLGIGQDWSVATRSRCIARGMQHWGLTLNNRGGLRFLGSIAAQGGVPLSLLAAERGNLGRLLRKVCSLARGGAVTHEDVTGWVESLAEQLPGPFRQPEIYSLLASLAMSIVKLSGRLHPAGEADPIVQLDQGHPGWRDEFPVEFEDAHARSLVTATFRAAMVGDGATPRAAPVVGVVRRIHQEGEGRFALSADLPFPRHVDSDYLARLFGVPGDRIPRSLELRYSAGSQRNAASVRRVPGHNLYRFGAALCRSEGLNATAEQSLEISTGSGALARCTLPAGVGLSPDVPWVFESPSVANAGGEFLRQGGGRCAQREVLVVAPAGAMVEGEAGGSAEHCGAVDGLRADVWRIQGIVRCDIDGASFRIQTGRASSEVEDFAWSGDRIWGIFERPAFRGTPTLSRSIAGATHAAARVRWDRAPGSGPMTAHWPADGPVDWRAKVVCLPPTALGVEPLPGPGPTSGIVLLRSWGAVGAISRSPALEVDCDATNGDLAIRMRWMGDGIPPPTIELDLCWARTTATERVRLPFPGRGIDARLDDGTTVPHRTRVGLDDLYGIRLIANARSATVMLSLSGRAQVRRSRHITLSPSREAKRVEVAPSEFREPIEEFFSSTALLDADVEFSLVTEDGDRFDLLISRFTNTLDRSDPDIFTRVASQDLDLLAVRLDELGGVPRAVSRSSGGHGWVFDAAEYTPGPWLIYPAAWSRQGCRPLLRTVVDESDAAATSELGHAISRPTTARANSISNELKRLAADPHRSGWQLLEDLARHMGHVHLAALDVWTAIAADPHSVAHLALRPGFTDAFVQKLGVELPFCWELVPLDAWVAAADAARTGASALELPPQLVDSHLKDRAMRILEVAPSLEALLKIATREEVHRPVAGLDRALHAMLFAGGDCALQRTLLRVDSGQPPLRELAADLRETLDAQPDLQTLLPGSDVAPAWRPAIELPVILAYYAVSPRRRPRWFDAPDSALSIRHFRRLYPEWFSEAFALTSMRMLSRGTTTNTGEP